MKDTKKKRFAMIGVAGYIARKHLQAIKDVDGELIAAMDIRDGVGILDSFFPDCEFFLEKIEFLRYLKDNPIDYLVVCTPNHYHHLHCSMGLLNIGCDVICEKPLVTSPSDMESLKEFEDYSGHCVYTIMQLRHHPVVKEMRSHMKDEMERGNTIDMSVFYYTPRGSWYDKSWKGDFIKSGGLLFNIGIHLFDLMVFLFEEPISVLEGWFIDNKKTAHGYLEAANFDADIYWELSTDNGILKAGRTMRDVIINEKKFALDNGFTDLHTESYRQILAGNGFGIGDVEPSIILTDIITKQIYQP